MRTACWLILVAALFASSSGCDSESSPEDASDAAADGGRRKVRRNDAGTGQKPPTLDGSVRPDAEPDAQTPPMDAGADVGTPEESDGGADLDGGANPGGGGVRYAGGDGSSCEAAVVILGAKTDFDGVFAEYEWLRKHYPGAVVVQQSLTTCDGAWTDILRIRTANSEIRNIYFNIDDFFGK
jgi:hypothetical protein